MKLGSATWMAACSAVVLLSACVTPDTRSPEPVLESMPPSTSMPAVSTAPSTSTTMTSAPVVDSESLSLPESLTAVADGLVAVGMELSLDSEGQEVWDNPFVGTIRLRGSTRFAADQCYWDSWYLTPPHLTGHGGVVLVTGDGILLCEPGREVQVLGRAGILGKVVIDKESHLVLSSEDGIELLSLDDLGVQALFNMDSPKGQPASVSFGGGLFLVVVESTLEPIQSRTRNVMLFDTAGDEIEIDLPSFAKEDNPHLASAAISDDGATLLLAEEFSDGTTDLVTWDLSQREEASRIRIIEPFVPGEDPFDFGREFVSYIESSQGRILLGMATIEAESFLSGVVLVDPDGGIHDISNVDGFGIIAASFID